MTADPRQHSPAAERNQGPIFSELQRLWPALCRVLEIASGTGQHAAAFARQMPGWHWQASDPEAVSCASVAAWCEGLANVPPPLRLDVHAHPWPVPADTFDAVFCANMLHISPWSSCAALMQGAARALRPGGRLVIYGPFIQADVSTAASNLAFDADLRARNSAWGLRQLPLVCQEASAQGLGLLDNLAMPANNRLLVFGVPPGTEVL